VRRLDGSDRGTRSYAVELRPQSAAFPFSFSLASLALDVVEASAFLDGPTVDALMDDNYMDGS
jgi:hypothetical protein